jgi:hypothetical protein
VYFVASGACRTGDIEAVRKKKSRVIYHEKQLFRLSSGRGASAFDAVR